MSGNQDQRGSNQVTRSRHETTTLQLNGQPIEVDNGMAELIAALWSLDIRTTNCCEGTEEDWRSAYVAIDGRDWGRFLDLFADDLEVAREARSARLNIHEEPRDGRMWAWHSNLRESFDTSTYHDGEAWRLSVALRFRPSFLPQLTTAVLEGAGGSAHA